MVPPRFSPPTRDYDGYIFDCDGTLADTMPLHWQAWHQVARRHGIDFPEERFYALGGVPSRDILDLLRSGRGYFPKLMTRARAETTRNRPSQLRRS